MPAEVLSMRLFRFAEKTYTEQQVDVSGVQLGCAGSAHGHDQGLWLEQFPA